MNCVRAAGFALVLASGCNLSRSAFIEPDPGRVRAGVLELQWRRRMIDYSEVDWRPQFHGTPAYDQDSGRVYAGSNDNGMYALRSWDGAVIWRFETLGRVDASPTVYADQLFFGSSDGALYSLDARTGVMRWRVGTAGEVVHPAHATSTNVYFVNANDTVLAVSRSDGATRWRYRRNPPGGITLSGHAGLLHSRGRLYTGFSDGTVVCLDETDGSVVWERDTSADIENIEARNEAHEAIDVDTTPVRIGDSIFAASFSAGIYALDATGGGERWRLGDLERVSSLSTDGRFLYAASSATGLIKVDPESGTILWARDLGSRAIVGAVPITPTLLAVPTADRNLWLVRASDGEPVEALMSGYGYSSVPATGGNRMFVASNGGVLSSFLVTNRGPLATW